MSHTLFFLPLLAIQTTWLSPDAVECSADKTTWITTATAPSLLAVDTAQAKLLRTIPLSECPTGIAAGPNKTLIVTASPNDEPCGQLSLLNADGTPRRQSFWRRIFSPTPSTVPTGAGAMAPLYDGTTIWVPCRFSGTLEAHHPESLQRLASIPCHHQPIGVAMGVSNRLLFVANHLPLDPATNMCVSARVTLIDPARYQVLRHIPLPSGSTGVRGITSSPDHRFIYVTHTLGRNQLPTTQLERGWMNTAALSIFDGLSGEYVNTVLLDDVDLGAANPWGVAVSPDGHSLAVAHAGTREVSVIDRVALHRQLERVQEGQSVNAVSQKPENVPYDLTFLNGIRRRIPLPGDGPHGVQFADNQTLVIPLYYSGVVAIVPLAPESRIRTIAPNGQPDDLSACRARRGEMLFNDASMCFQKWQSCASCHPDGRADGLNWDLLNDGLGNPKQTKSLFLSDLTPPTMITGIRANMEACNRAGLRHIQFVTRPEEDALCLDAYVREMPLHAPVSPYAKHPLLAQGKAVFAKAGCAFCHPAERGLYTNRRAFDLGLGIGSETNRPFDTPTLREVWRTPPYLYDGRSLSIHELLTVDNPGDCHGHTSKLTPDELHALEIYILSL